MGLAPKKPTKRPTKRAPKKPTVPVNKDREEAMEYLRAVMKNGDDEQARVLAAIGLAQLSVTPIH